MARGENPGQVIEWTIHSNQAYSETADFGNENAGKDLMLGYNGDLVGDGAPILGKFMDVDKNQSGSVLKSGFPMIMRQGAKGECTVNSQVVGSGGGYVKNGTGNNAEGRVLKVLEDVAMGRVLVWFP